MITHLRHVRYFCTSRSTVNPIIQIYSCKLRDKTPVQLQPNTFTSFYTCGPTVYDSAHIGHASCYVRLDILQRILKNHFHLNLVTAMNITDIDDKIIKRANECGTPWQEISKHYEQEFWADLQRLNVLQPDIKLRVTDHMPAIVAFIEKLISKGFAYKSTDDSIYFETSRYPQYGKLQNIPAEAASSTSKKNASDFALWKSAKPGEPSWESSFGRGRPGWHIECSTLASQVFGKRLDFHAGGLDLRFPHHENEEAQSCCYHHVEDWVSHWIHTGQLHLEGQTHKMSKSLKNTISISELLEKFSADEFRMLCLLCHYRSVIEFGDESMTIAANVLRKFHSFFDDARAYIAGVKPAASVDVNLLLAKVSEVDSKIDAFLKNDFHTANVITVLGDLVSAVHKSINQKSQELVVASECGAVQGVSNYIQDKLTLFGMESFGSHSQSTSELGVQSQDQIIDKIVQLRSSIRNEAIETKDRKLFALCDKIRDQLKETNVEIKDHGRTTSWSYVKR